MPTWLTMKLTLKFPAPLCVVMVCRMAGEWCKRKVDRWEEREEDSEATQPLTGGHEDSSCGGLHPVADGAHHHRVVPPRLQLEKMIKVLREQSRSHLVGVEECLAHNHTRAVPAAQLLLLIFNLGGA